MNKVQLNPSTGKFTLNLKPQERDLILETVTILDDDIKKKFQFAVMQKSHLKITLTDTEYDIFEDMLMTEARLCRKKKLQDQMYILIGELQFNEESFYEVKLDDAELDDTINQFSEAGFPDILINQIKSELKKNHINNLDQLNHFLKKEEIQYNQTPQHEIGGLTPDQAHKLIYAKWDDPNSCFQYNQNLSEDEIRSIPFVKNARLFLQLIQNEGGKIKATAKGNLNRDFLNKLFPLFYTEEQKKEPFFDYYKTLTEDRVFEIHIMRLILETSGLIRRQRTTINITKKSQQYIGGDHSHELFQLLFKTFFNKFNLAYLDCSDEQDGLQDTLFYTFYMIQKMMDDWQSFKTIADQITLPLLKEHSRDPKYFHYRVHHRILNPLVQFGLLEYKKIQIKGEWIDYDYQYRKSPLYDKFFRFNI